MFRGRDQFSALIELINGRQCVDDSFFDEALDWVAKARARFDEAYTGRPRSRRRAEALADSYTGRALAGLGRLDEAYPLLERSAAVLAEPNPDAGFDPDMDLMATLYEMAVVDHVSGRWERSLATGEQFLALLPQAGSVSQRWLDRLTVRYMVVGFYIVRLSSHLHLGQMYDALAASDRAYAAAGSDEDLVDHCTRWRVVFHLWPKPGSAPTRQEVLAAVRSVHVEPADLHAVMDILEDVLAAEQRRDDALPYWDAALSIVRDADEDGLAGMLVHYANLLNECDRPAEALALSDEIESLLGSEASILAAYWRGVRGEGYAKAGRVEEAITSLDESLAMAAIVFADGGQPPVYDQIRSIRDKLALQ